MHGIFRTLGWNVPALITDPNWALTSIIIADTWEWFPFTMLMVLAALQMMPQELLDAAKVDGASPWQLTRHITLPFLQGVLLVAGRYEGVDERVVEVAIDRELSVGDYVLSGGELPALVIIDALARLLPGALGDERSNVEDSFVQGLLDWPHYTRPESFEGHSVPPVLLSGDHAQIRRWRLAQAFTRTVERRPDMLSQAKLAPETRRALDEFLAARAAGNEDRGE